MSNDSFQTEQKTSVVQVDEPRLFNIVDLFNWAREDALVGQENGREFNRLGLRLSKAYGLTEPDGKDFDSTVLKNRIHRKYLSYLIEKLTNPQDRELLEDFLRDPVEFFSVKKRGENKLVSLILNPENKIFLDVDGKPVSFLQLIQNYYQDLGLDIRLSVDFRAIPPEEQEAFVNKVAAHSESKKNRNDRQQLQRDFAAVYSNDLIPFIKIQNDGKAIEAPIIASCFTFGGDFSEQASYVSRRLLAFARNNNPDLRQYIDESDSEPFFMITFWPEYLSSQNSSLLVPFPEKLSVLCHEINHAVEDLLEINEPDYSQQEQLRIKEEELRQRIRGINSLAELAGGYKVRETGSFHDINQEKIELERRKRMLNIIKEGGSELASHIFLRSQAQALEAFDPILSLAFRYLSQRMRWKNEYINGGDSEGYIYPVGLTLAEIIRRYGKSGDFKKVFYEEGFDSFRSFDLSQLIRILTSEVKVTALGVSKGSH